MPLRDFLTPSRAKYLVIGGGFVAMMAVGALLAQLRWIRSALAGPVPVTLSELHSLESPATLANPWISFTFEKFIDTNRGVVAKQGGKAVLQVRFVLIQVQDRWLLAELPGNFSGNQLVGVLDVWQSPRLRQVVEDVKANAPPAVGERLLPYQLDAVSNYRGRCLGLLTVMGVLFLLGGGVAGLGLFIIVRDQREKRGPRPPSPKASIAISETRLEPEEHQLGSRFVARISRPGY